MNIVEKAEEFATKCHEGQFRKDGKTPYINHPRAVVYLLKRVGITDETILDYANLGVDIISIGALTHSSRSLNFSLKIEESQSQ